MATLHFKERDTQDHVSPACVMHQVLGVLEAATQKAGSLRGELTGLLLLADRTRELVERWEQTPNDETAITAAVDAVAGTLSVFEGFDERWDERLIYATESLLLLAHSRIVKSWDERQVEVQHG